MLAFSGCYFGGGEKERFELREIRKRWETLPVRKECYSFIISNFIFKERFSTHWIMSLTTLIL